MNRMFAIQKKEKCRLVQQKPIFVNFLRQRKKAGRKALLSAVYSTQLLLGACVQFASKGGLSSSSSILMKNSLRSSLIDVLHSKTHSLCLVSSAGIDSSCSLFDRCLQSGIISLVSGGLGRDHFYAFFGRFDVWHCHTSFCP